MTASLVFLGVMMAVIIGWLLRHTFNTQPWIANTVAEGRAFEEGDPRSLKASSKKIMLLAFLAVLVSLFSLFISAYAIRMDYYDWRPLTEPNILWFNTALLVLGSVAMQWAKHRIDRGLLGQARLGIAAGAALTAAFLVGQWMAWQQLTAAGAFLQSNPANAFFYLLTGIHGVHLVGGLAVLGNTLIATWRTGFDTSRIRQSIELCTIYWHFLLLVWIGLFWLMLST